MKYLELPTLDYLLDFESTVAFPYTKTFDEAMNDPFCYLHTSGSTGLPKPIPWSHGLIGTMDAVRLLPPVGKFADLVPWTSDWNEGDKIYSSFPMSHVGELCLYPCSGVQNDMEAKELLTDDFPHRALESLWIF